MAGGVATSALVLEKSATVEEPTSTSEKASGAVKTSTAQQPIGLWDIGRLVLNAMGRLSG